MTHHRITTTIALALALAATAAPVASADPAPLAQAEAASANASPHGQPSSGPCSDVCSGQGYSTVHLTTATPASTGPCSEVCSAGGYVSVSQPASTPDDSGAALPHDSRPRSIALSSAYKTASIPPTVVRVVTHSDGFDWGDAGIGAGGTLALTLIALGGVLAATNRRSRQTPDQQLSTSS